MVRILKAYNRGPGNLSSEQSDWCTAKKLITLRTIRTPDSPQSRPPHNTLRPSSSHALAEWGKWQGEKGVGRREEEDIRSKILTVLIFPHQVPHLEFCALPTTTAREPRTAPFVAYESVQLRLCLRKRRRQKSLRKLEMFSLYRLLRLVGGAANWKTCRICLWILWSRSVAPKSLPCHNWSISSCADTSVPRTARSTASDAHKQSIPRRTPRSQQCLLVEDRPEKCRRLARVP